MLVTSAANVFNSLSAITTSGRSMSIRRSRAGTEAMTLVAGVTGRLRTSGRWGTTGRTAGSTASTRTVCVGSGLGTTGSRAGHAIIPTTTAVTAPAAIAHIH